MQHRILLIEGNPNLVAVLMDVLAPEGYAVESTPDGNTAISSVQLGQFDLVILDIMLPGPDGFEVCRELRRQGIDIPIVILTARTELRNKVLGLSLGADDYITKPFDPPELLARIQALLRRADFQRSTGRTKYHFGSVCVDPLEGKVLPGGQPVNVSTKELQLLRYFLARRGTILARKELLREVWGYQSALTRTLDVHVAMLRQKLEENPQQPRYIVTIRGEGYMFCG